MVGYIILAATLAVGGLLLVLWQRERKRRLAEVTFHTRQGTAVLLGFESRFVDPDAVTQTIENVITFWSRRLPENSFRIRKAFAGATLRFMPKPIQVGTQDNRGWTSGSGMLIWWEPHRDNAHLHSLIRHEAAHVALNAIYPMGGVDHHGIMQSSGFGL
jgi:hypothetical protein